MSRISNLVRGGLIAAGLVVFAAAPAGAASPPASSDHPQSCFYVTQWRGWKAPSPDVLYLGVNGRDVYKVELAAGPAMPWSGVELISKTRGSGSVCTALDLDLSVTDGHGYREALIAKSITKLTPAEAAAIPPRFRP
jgi:hypothetical protein